MCFSGMYGITNEREGIATIQTAIDRGVSLLDTGDFYGMGHNESLIGRAIAGRRDKVQLSVKFGALRAPDGAWLGVDNRPAAVKAFAAYSLQRLGVDVIDIYRPARLDPNVPIEDTVGAISELIERGYVRQVGLSEVGADTIRRAHAVHPIADLQIEYSLISRRPEDTIFPTLNELGVSATLYGILSRGLLSGRKPTGTSDFRAHLPRFSAQNLSNNERVVANPQRFADKRRYTPAQACLAWVLAKQPSFVPLLGAQTPEQLNDLLQVLRKPLSPEEVRDLEAIVAPEQVAGTRYAEAHMADLDSER